MTFATPPIAVIESSVEWFVQHHEMHCDHGSTSIHTPGPLTKQGLAQLVAIHEANTAYCGCGHRYEAANRRELGGLDS